MSVQPATVSKPGLRGWSEQDLIRRRRGLRILCFGISGLGGLVLAAFLGSLVYNTLVAGGGAETAAGTEVLAQPRMVGTDDKGRPYVITAATATRDANNGERILLQKPVLEIDQGKSDQTRMTAGVGVYDEGTGRLEVNQGVKVAGPRGNFDTASSIFDSRTGDITGPGAVRGEGAFGTIQAGSYSGENNGKRIIYKGGVRARLNMK